MGVALVLPAAAGRAFNVWLTAWASPRCRSCAPPRRRCRRCWRPAIWAGIGFQIVIFLAG
jgi:hypothetical protein